MRLLSSPEYALPPAVPECTAVTHYRRTGKAANFHFFCKLRRRQGPDDGDEPKGFWLPFTCMLRIPESKCILEASKWRMSDHIHEYSEGEEAWSDDVNSADEEAQSRRARRGQVRALRSPPGRRHSRPAR